eukprot:CAMPEP_0117626592 /NCGR_PEP_ID=MMETSP0802-20121206/1492_1 /TAXON_ID=38833 /ORGANISM="Micromonas sp., Strain CCMP2099" /LENGTH=156 /DNA_ID=CAMNT_0005430701 /DNA_START=79 /DNA_END=546 /DNA_ORIENTATION=-
MIQLLTSSERPEGRVFRGRLRGVFLREQTRREARQENQRAYKREGKNMVVELRRQGFAGNHLRPNAGHERDLRHSAVNNLRRPPGETKRLAETLRFTTRDELARFIASAAGMGAPLESDALAVVTARREELARPPTLGAETPPRVTRRHEVLAYMS